MSRIVRAEMHLFLDEAIDESELDGAAEFLKHMIPPQAIKGLGDQSGTVMGTVETGGLRLADDGTTLVVELAVDMGDADPEFDPPEAGPLVD